MVGSASPSPAHRARHKMVDRQSASEDAAFLVLTALAVYGTAYVALILLHPFGETRFVATSDAAGIVPPALAAALAWYAGQLSGEHVRTGWRCIALGCLAWAAGESAWFVYEVVLGQDPFPSIADAGYLVMLPLVAVGLIYLTSEGRKLQRCQPTLDGIALTLALVSFVWFFALRPTYSDSDSSLLEKAIGAAYPLGDLVLCFALAVAVQRRWEWRDAMVLASLFGGLVLLVGADVGFAYQSLNESFTSTSLVNVGWPLGFLAIAAAAGLSAAWAPPYTSSEDLTRPKPWRIALPLALLVPQLGLAGWSFAEEPLAVSLPLVVMTATTALVVALSIAISLGLVREVEAKRGKALDWIQEQIRRDAA